MIRKFFHYLFHDPRKLAIILADMLLVPFSDEFYLPVMWRLRFGARLDLEHPVTFNEKLQWLKLYDRRPEYTVMVDKVKAKEYVAGVIGEQYIIPTLGIWDSPDEIDFDKLPDRFVLKCNHNSGGECICRDKNELDISKVRRSLRKELKKDWYLHGREWVYKNVPRKILAEKYMVDESGTELKDYKVFCMNGEPEIIQVHWDRFTYHRQNLYDKNWNLLDFYQTEYPIDKEYKITRPEKLDEMLNLARKLAKGIPHVRVDFYCIGNRLYWGELTFFHDSGYGHWVPEEWDERLGRMIVLPPQATNEVTPKRGRDLILFSPAD